MPRCRETKPDGTPCERIVRSSQGYCYAHNPAKAEERRHNASRGGRARSNGELADLRKQLKDLAAGVLDGSVDWGRAAVANQIHNTLIRATEQERKMRELEELAGRLEEVEQILARRREDDRWGA
jgi:hypothetical protein